MRYVIIGAGPTGLSAAQTIKDANPEGEVILFGDENFFPYNRYLLTDFLCGSVKEEQLMIDTTQLFSDGVVKFRKGQRVKAVFPEKKQVKLAHNEVVDYDKLLIATGGKPSLCPILEPLKALIHRYYSLEDICLLKRQISDAKEVVVSGSGLSSLDLIRGMLALGKKVTYIFRHKQPDWYLIEPELYEKLFYLLGQRGVTMVPEDRVVAVAQQENRYTVTTMNKKVFDADFVFSWDHYEPDIQLIDKTGIEKKLGILVNSYMETSVKDIYAAGDCAEIYHPELKNYWINFGWPNALDQGRIAGLNMMGKKEAYAIRDVLAFNLMGKTLKARWWQ